MKAGFLLDVNVLIAMAWPTHRNHEKVLEWLARHAREGWANVPIDPDELCAHSLESGFFTKRTHPDGCALTPLQANLAHPAHRFWADEVSLIDSLQPFVQKLGGHQQVTDAYLLGLAIHKKGKLVTMDRAVRTLLPNRSPERDFVILI